MSVDGRCNRAMLGSFWERLQLTGLERGRIRSFRRFNDSEIEQDDWKNRTDRCDQTQFDDQFQSERVAARQFYAGPVLKRSYNTRKACEGDSNLDD
jgi:hypothetical protein